MSSQRMQCCACARAGRVPRGEGTRDFRRLMCDYRLCLWRDYYWDRCDEAGYGWDREVGFDTRKRCDESGKIRTRDHATV